MPTNQSPMNQASVRVDPEQVAIESGWKSALYSEFSAPYFAKIKQHLLEAKNAGKVIYPPGKLIFNAFDRTPFDQVRVVIIGQDPYHRRGQAMGLSFSVPQGITVPPSLKNIYKELVRSIEGFHIPNHGDLSAWAEQGVLLLNTSLTVEEGHAGSHARIGWQQFTNAAITQLSEQRHGIIFLLWGNFAKQKATLIDQNKHHILTAVHPSPLAGGAFIGCNHFAETNRILQARGEAPINWQV